MTRWSVWCGRRRRRGGPILWTSVHRSARAAFDALWDALDARPEDDVVKLGEELSRNLGTVHRFVAHVRGSDYLCEVWRAD